MRTIDKNKNDFESKAKNRDSVYSFDVEKSFDQTENQQFVVPWQMVKTKEGKNLVK